MGKELFDAYSTLTRRASEILGYDLVRLCVEDPDKQLDQTQYTQPALYVVNALGYLQKRDAGEARGDFFAGHSLGEYNALLAAEAFDFEAGLRLVQRRGELMGRAAGGTMAAVIGVEAPRLAALLAEAGLESIDLANYNTPRQTVIAGPKEDIARARRVLTEQKEKIRFIPLSVSAPFHSRYMAEVRREFAAFVQGFSFARLTAPVIANATAQPYEDHRIAELLCEQIAAPVRWTDSIRYLLARGAVMFEEIHAQSLTRMVREIRETAPPLLLPEPPRAKAPMAPAADALRTRSAPPSAGASPEQLGSASFRAEHGVKYAYVAGSMYRGIASRELVVRLGKAGLLAFLGTGGLDLARVDADLRFIQSELGEGRPYGANLLHDPTHPDHERATVELYLARGVRCIEAAAYIGMTPALVWFRTAGLRRDPKGQVVCDHKVVAKVSRPEVAEAFMRPAPARILQQLVEQGRLTPEQARMAEEVPVAHDICAEADSGGHTDRSNPIVLLPAMRSLRDRMMQHFRYPRPIRVGLAGGIGTPEAAAAAFVMGADFIVTGSINQCTVESGAHEIVKDMLEGINVQDTDYAPAGDMFELGAEVQVLKRSVFFPARASKLYNLYQQYDALDDIPARIRGQIESRYFGRTFDEVYEETKRYFRERGLPEEIEKAESNPKHRMALVFRWYLAHTTRIALEGDRSQQVNFQVHTGPALGAFNQWVKGTPLESWRRRHVDDIAERIMQGAAEILAARLQTIPATPGPRSADSASLCA